MLLNDIRYALRLMRRSPGFTAVAVLSLALGIGANTAIYSLFYTVMLRQLPVPHSEQLVELVRDSPTELHWPGYWAWDQYEYLRDHNHVFLGITGMGFDNLAAVRTPGSDLETLIQESVPGNYFQVLGLKPAIGRLIGPEDVPASGDGDAAVVSWSYWNRRFHRDPAILGKRIFYNDAPKTIIGVAPGTYVGPRVGSRTDLWTPASHYGLTMLARLKPGVTIRQAQAEIAVVYQGLQEQDAVRGRDRRVETRMELLPAGAGLARVRDQYGKPLVLLTAIVGLLLLLACINMASMLLARSAGRQRELAVRVGLGAGRGRLVRQMLTESLLLSGAGTVAGVVVAYYGIGVLVRIMASGRAFEHIEIEVHPDLNLVLFTAAIALLTGLLFGLAPAWYAFRAQPAMALRQAGKGGDTWFWRLFGKGLVAAQVALSIFLVTAAAVFLNHLARLRNFDLGFRSDHVLLVTLDSAHSGYQREQLGAPYQELLARMETIPQVRSASITGCTPLQGCGSGSRYLIAEGHVDRPEDRLRTAVVFVAPRYFETLGISLIAGRDFNFRDVGRRRVAIVSQAMARHYFTGVNPIGKRVSIDRDPKTGGWFGSDEPYEIIGLVGDVKSFELRDAPYPAIYFNMFQERRFLYQFELRTSVDPASLAATVRQMVREVLKTVPVKTVTTLADQVDSNIVPERLIATLSEFFGCLGVVLTGIGLYGLLAYTVARRTNEIGIRMALGATASSVSRLVLRDVLGMVCAGFVTGASMVLWSRPLATSVFSDLKLESALPLTIGGGAMIAVALLASYVPVRRAAGVDPMVALRHE
ncbi:MAG TPA: ABC transporter permease [Candidatus Acidoferrales bacterium]|jgi:putative ABC transport system permease protein|nr:ABC transporter permease [Candidatus Acidoferrales bacterium]